jgi:DNA-binding response OmpR family regulator
MEHVVQGRASLRGRRVLVVEDEALESLMIEDLLTQAGCTVIGPAASTDSALALIEQEAIDCAVLDVKLLDGPVFPVADTLAARGVPFVFATGCAAEAISARYAGVPRIDKVYDNAQLLGAVSVTLDPKPRAA